MARSPKQRFIDEVNALLDSVSVTSKPDRTLVSHALHDALIEILAEVNRSRTNWQLVAALTGAKSYVGTTAVGQSCNDPFWAEEQTEHDPSVYGVLDTLHFRAAMRANVLPSGLTVFSGTVDGVRVHHGEVDTSASTGSPTLRLIAQERARIVAGVAGNGR